jgi:signal peptidase II
VAPTHQREDALSKEITNRRPLLLCISAIGFGLDLWTKILAVRHLSGGVVKRLVGDHLELVLVYNRAAVFGLDPRHVIPGFPVNLFFSIFTLIAIVVLVLYFRSLKKTDTLMHYGLAAVLPGALGNLFDRILHPARGVVDFIKVDLNFWPLNPWPVFNLADVWVTIGVMLMIIAFVVEEQQRKHNTAVSIRPVSTGAHADSSDEPPER